MEQNSNSGIKSPELSDILRGTELADRARKADFSIEYLERQIQAIERSRFGEYVKLYAKLARDTLLPVAMTVGAVGLSNYLYQGAKAHPESANYAALAIASLAVMLIQALPEYITEVRKHIDDLKRLPQSAQFYRDMLSSLQQSSQ